MAYKNWDVSISDSIRNLDLQKIIIGDPRKEWSEYWSPITGNARAQEKTTSTYTNQPQEYIKSKLEGIPFPWIIGGILALIILMKR